MKKQIFGGTVGLFIVLLANSTSSLGMARKASGYASSIGVHAKDLSAALKDLDTATQTNQARLDTVITRYRTALDQAKKNESEAKTMQARYQARADELAKRQIDWNKELSGVGQADSNTIRQQGIETLQRLASQAEAQERDLEKLKSESTASHENWDRARLAATDIQAKLNSQAEESLGQKLDLNEPEKLSEQLQTLLNARKVETVHRLMDSFIDQIKDDYNQSQLLLADIDVLETKFALSKERIKYLQEKINPKLDNTLLGQYIDKKISSRTSCAQIRACAGETSPPAAIESLDKAIKLITPAPQQQQPVERNGTSSAN